MLLLRLYDSSSKKLLMVNYLQILTQNRVQTKTMYIHKMFKSVMLVVIFYVRNPIPFCISCTGKLHKCLSRSINFYKMGLKTVAISHISRFSYHTWFLCYSTHSNHLSNPLLRTLHKSIFIDHRKTRSKCNSYVFHSRYHFTN